ncbi:MAG: hypothetical protein UT68_C0001G0100 [Parcubacteria group bacterium GW2011_GWC2_40_10]|nr:MAG: hypothetical protein UT25_C0001G0099 [Parcubacteria group bacterium GW2011_GWC1_39_12]KKR19623.1 MAG: hypothetical protein UT49_C0001G0099 [Parcubacteria group bacterium GW2011_GWF1_39_37]KKR35777.1 MAG: hypothetical protein UT68_C0001G0100 [Parcubacteria group bacterium GW2011_GWC2_40_10]KKR52591.1 MAG: hypothetical protein UT89_C0001G0099 [Parcubacteria group bacterium GW2011_GWE1_40_20]KKR80682.1 MAG: hypothetical protein UU27_C0023G0005 [Parcubacteria group bacterium GW2011_GWD1_40_
MFRSLVIACALGGLGLGVLVGGLTDSVEKGVACFVFVMLGMLVAGLVLRLASSLVGR